MVRPKWKDETVLPNQITDLVQSLNLKSGPGWRKTDTLEPAQCINETLSQRSRYLTLVTSVDEICVRHT